MRTLFLLGFGFCFLVGFSSCSTDWKDKHDEAFVQNCLDNIEEGVEYDPNLYCNCMLNQVKAARPNVTEVQEIVNADLEKMAKACLEADQ